MTPDTQLVRRRGRKRPRRKNTFAAYQANKVDETARLKLAPALQRLRSRRGREPFKKLTHLAEALQGLTGLHRTTLMRNRHYLALMVQFLEGQSGAVGTVSKDSASPGLLQAQLRAAEGEIANLKHVTKVLRARLANLGAKEAELPKEKRPESAVRDVSESLNGNIPFQDTAHLVLLLTDHINDTMQLPAGIKRIQIDPDKKEVRDMSLRPGRQRILGKARGKWLFEWLIETHDFHASAPE